MIVIIDYGMGNLRSVQKGFERVGHPAVISDRVDDIAAADKLVLPGVGAFGDAMGEIHRRGLAGPIEQSIAEGKPFLGICLGLQLLFETGHEGGRHQGLGIIPGDVIRFDLPPGYKVPHMGWNQLSLLRPCPLYAGLEQGTYAYFVHSFHVVPADPTIIATQTDYARPFVSSIHRGNVMATQFHPEKSQQGGLAMLANFGGL